MKERGKDKISVTQGIYLPMTRQPQLLACPVGTSRVRGMVAFQRPKGKENGFADIWGKFLPARMGLWVVRAMSPFKKGHGDRSIRQEGQGQPILEESEKQKWGGVVQQKEAK